MFVPRICGKVGVVEKPAKLAGKFAFTVEVYELNSGEFITEVGPFGYFDTMAIAKAELENKVKHLSEVIGEALTGEKPTEYFDLKDGGARKTWLLQ